MKQPKFQITAGWPRRAISVAVIALLMVLYPLAWTLAATGVYKVVGGAVCTGWDAITCSLLAVPVVLLLGLGILVVSIKRMLARSLKWAVAITVLSFVLTAMLIFIVMGMFVADIFSSPFGFWFNLLDALTSMLHLNIIWQFCIWFVSIYGALLIVELIKPKKRGIS